MPIDEKDRRPFAIGYSYNKRSFFGIRQKDAVTLQ